MPQISNLSFNVSFEPHNPNRVGLTNTTPSLPAGFVGIFKVTQPDGYVRNGDINTPDVTNVVSSCVVTLVPDSAGQLQQGQYIIEFIGNAPGYLSTSFIRTFTLQYTAATISLRNDFDIFTPQLAYTDISNYSVSGWTISSGPTRKWDATSPTTGTISGTNSSINIRYNNQYYAENYTIQFEVNVAYASQAYPWLTITHTRTQTTSVTACIPKSLEDLTQAVEALREESNASCGGDWAKFEKANALYAHLLNMLRLVLIAGQHQDGFFDVYQQLLTYIQNGSVACTTIGQVIPPYDFSDYESSIYDGQSSYCQLVGDGVNTTYRVNHQLGDTCVVVQVYEVATGKQVFCDLAVSTINSIDITFYEPPTLNQYRVVAVAGAIGLRGQGFQPGGLTGQILRKKTNADFDTEWADVTVALPLLVPYTGATQDVFLGEFGVETGYVRFDTTPTAVPAVPAVMSWNDADGTVDLKLKGNSVSIQLGQEMVSRVVNKTGANLLASQYKAVRVRKVSEGGAQGQRLAVVLAQANTEFLSTDMLGIVTENISNNQEGFITTFGAVKNIDTTGSLQGETWVDGDILFLSPTVPGGLTNVKPSAPDHLSIVGYVEYAHQNNGKIFVHVQTSWELDELHNVSITNPVNNQVLKYNGTLWVNSTIPAVTSVGLATATSGVTITDTPVTSSGVININIATAAAGQSGLLSASDWATFNAKQSAITLTTTGNSGAATFVGSTLNIPNYTLAGLGGVPSTRSLTINGTAYDLSADRVWSVGTVTSVAALTIGTAGTDITSTVATGTTTPVITLNIPTASASNRGALSAADWTTFNSKVGGSGTVNYVSKFTAAGTIGNSSIVDNGTGVGVGISPIANTKLYIRTNTATDAAIYSDNGVNTGFVVKFGSEPITNIGNDFNRPLGFLTNNTERLRITSGGNVGIGTDSPNDRMTIQSVTSVASAITFRANNVTSTSELFLGQAAGNEAYVYNRANQPMIFGTNNTERLRITSGGDVGIGTASPTGTANRFVNIYGAASNELHLTNATTGTASTDGFTILQSGNDIYQYNYEAGFLELGTSNTSRLRIFANGRIGVNTTTDAGYQFDINGTLRSVNGANFATTSGNVGIGTASPASILNVRASSATFTIDDSGDGISKISFRPSAASYAERAFLSVDYGTAEMRIAAGASGGAYFQSFYTNATERLRISSTGVITVANLAGSGARLVVADASGNLSATTVSSSIVGGSGTTNYIPKFTAASTIGNSQIFDNGTNVGVGTTSPSTKLHVAGASTLGGYVELNTSAASASYFNMGYSAANKSYWGSAAGFDAGNADEYLIGTLANSTFNIYTNATRRLNIFGNGNIGIGTTTDAGYKTDIAGTLRSTLGANFATTSGNVGVGTASPAYKLTVKAATDYNIGIGLLGGVASINALNDAQSAYTQMRIDATNLLINTYSGSKTLLNTSSDAGDYKLQVAGNIYNTGSAVLAATSGNVGIGTASPSTILHVQGTSPVLTVRNNITASATQDSANNKTAGSLTFGANGSFEVVASIEGKYQSDASFGRRADLLFSTRSVENALTEKARLTSSGELLIGTTSDAGAYALQVAGAIYNTGSAVLAATSGNVGIGTTTAVGKLTINSALGNHIQLQRSGQTDRAIVISSSDQLNFGTWASPTQMVLTSNGRLLLNTTTDAGYQLDVNGAGRFAGALRAQGTIQATNGNDNNSGDFLGLLIGSSTGATARTASIIKNTSSPYDLTIRSQDNTSTTTGSLIFVNGSTEQMRINSSGNVGIGTASPSVKLDVSQVSTGSVVRFQGDAALLRYLEFKSIDAGAFTGAGWDRNVNSASGFHTWSTAGTERLRIFANGRVAINTTTDAGYQLDVNGGTRVTGRVTVTGNDTLGLSIARAGTSAISSEIYNGGGDNGWLLWGVESSAGGVIFPGTTAYASVFGSFRNVPIQFATNNTVRMTIDGGGSVGIGVASPSASAILQVDSTTKGMLPPRMTTTQRDAITSPATGLIVYDTTVNKLSVYNGTTWKYAQYE